MREFLPEIWPAYERAAWVSDPGGTNRLLPVSILALIGAPRHD